MSDSLKDLIETERTYFEKVFERQAKATTAMREAWRAETVMERRRRISSEVYDLFGGVVAYGPFRGLTLAKNNWWGGADFGSMLLGLYEKEVLDYFFSPECGRFETFVDVGAADGYYAIGMLKSDRVQRAICFELSTEGQNTIAENASANGVAGKITIFGAADGNFYTALSDIDLTRALVLIDIEGAEFDVLDDVSLQGLRQATIVIEIHNWTEDFWKKYERFLTVANRYFHIGYIAPVGRDLTQFPELNDFTDDNRYLICSEGRPNMMRFMHLKPRT
jgi:hypothetical protein